MKIQSAIIKGAKILQDKFKLTPYLDSEILMSKAINKDKKYILLNSKKEIKKKDYYFFLKLIKLRSFGKPIAYLIKKKIFGNLNFLFQKTL